MRKKKRRKNEEIGLLKSVLLLPVELLELLSEDLFTTFTSKEVSAKYEKEVFIIINSQIGKPTTVFSVKLSHKVFAALCKNCAIGGRDVISENNCHF